MDKRWTGTHRGVILVILASLIAYGAGRFYFNSASVSEPQPTSSPAATQLADRIDPNTADISTLTVLPLIGESHATDIIAYRERHIREHPGDIAFKNLTDLLKIRGIGAATIEQLRPYLIFPLPDRPTTQP